VDNDGYITMTARGREVAEQLYERHTILTKMLMALGVDEKTATEDACRIEHVISDESFMAVKKHYLGYKD
jgi:Mn-dependent DtxR family transcriptional regulator